MFIVSILLSSLHHTHSHPAMSESDIKSKGVKVSDLIGDDMKKPQWKSSPLRRDISVRFEKSIQCPHQLRSMASQEINLEDLDEEDEGEGEKLDECVKSDKVQLPQSILKPRSEENSGFFAMSNEDQFDGFVSSATKRKSRLTCLSSGSLTPGNLTRSRLLHSVIFEDHEFEDDDGIMGGIGRKAVGSRFREKHRTGEHRKGESLRNVFDSSTMTTDDVMNSIGKGGASRMFARGASKDLQLSSVGRFFAKGSTLERATALTHAAAAYERNAPAASARKYGGSFHLQLASYN